MSTKIAKWSLTGGIHPPNHKTISNTTQTRFLPDLPGTRSYTYSPKRITTERLIKRWPQILNETSDYILNTIRQAGIQGMGGGGFATAKKITLGKQDPKPITTLLINAMECEPFITTDDRLLREFAKEIVIGIGTIAHTLPELNQIVIGIEDNKPEAIKALETAINELQIINDSRYFKSINLMIAPTKYPSGGEKQLVQLLTGTIIPYNQYLIEHGYICFNVATCFAVYEAVIQNRPLTHRLVTLTGNGLHQKHRGNYWLPIGITLAQLFQTLNISLTPKQSILLGGPFMGKAVLNLNQPIEKTTQCILLPSESDHQIYFRSPQPSPCIQCGKCVSACPVNLLPHQLDAHIQAQQPLLLKKETLLTCLECGACNFVCPSNIPLVQHFKAAKTQLGIEIDNKAKSAKAKSRYEQRQQRMGNRKPIRRIPKNVNSNPTLSAQNTRADKSISHKSILKNQYKQAKKKWQDAEKALKKFNKDAISNIENKTVLDNLCKKVESLKHEAEELKQRIDSSDDNIDQLRDG